MRGDTSAALTTVVFRTALEAAQLPLPRHFAQVSELVTEDMVAAPCGPDPEPYLAAVREFEQADFD